MFLRNTLKEFAIFCVLLWLGYLLSLWLQRWDATVGTLDPSFWLVAIAGLTKLYLAVGVGHGVWRLMFPTVANWADHGGFAADWAQANTHFSQDLLVIQAAAKQAAFRRMWLATVTALASFGAAILALFFL